MSDKNLSEEIDIFDAIKIIIDNKKLILIFISLGLFLSIVFNTFSKKSYVSYTTFFLNSESPRSNNPFSRYTNILGIGSVGDIDVKVKEIFASNRIRHQVAAKLLPDFENEISQLPEKKRPKTQKDKINYVKNEIKLHKSVKHEFSKEKFHSLSIKYTSPEIAFKVISLYISEVDEINKAIELSPKKNLFTIIDPPKIPEYSSYPKKLKNNIIGIALGFMLSIIFLFLKKLKSNGLFNR